MQSSTLMFGTFVVAANKIDRRSYWMDMTTHSRDGVGRRGRMGGHPPGAQFALGGMYFTGRSVPKDYVTAHMWFNLAAAGGSKNAAWFRGALSGMMRPGQIAEAQKLACEWLIA
jgi:TPR repeat protein